MKRLFFSLFVLACTVAATQAQQPLVIGEKAPEMRVSGWQGMRVPSTPGKAYLIDFFHSSNDQCTANLSKLNALQNTYAEKLNVILISREEFDKIVPYMEGMAFRFYIGMDDNAKTFGNYGVRFVPFAALVDKRGRLVWTGNVANLTDEIINKAL